MDQADVSLTCSGMCDNELNILQGRFLIMKGIAAQVENSKGINRVNGPEENNARPYPDLVLQLGPLPESAFEQRVPQSCRRPHGRPGNTPPTPTPAPRSCLNTSRSQYFLGLCIGRAFPLTRGWAGGHTSHRVLCASCLLLHSERAQAYVLPHVSFLDMGVAGNDDKPPPQTLHVCASSGQNPRNKTLAHKF